MMSAEQWRQLEQIYHAALEQAADQRAGFVAKACGGNAELRREIESLLAQDLASSGLLNKPAWENASHLLRTESATKDQEQAFPPLTGTVTFRYRLVEALGAGGMGVVYKAEDTRLHRMVALKFLTEPRTHEPEAVQRFEREARAASALNHPNICTLYDIGEYENRSFLVLELLEGQTLQQRIQRGPLDLDEVLDLGIQIADALDSAHEKGIIHRDIKPANLFITTRGQSKILDFGVAKLHIAGEHNLTNSGSIVGTVAYMSPEQARGEELDARADLFSLGAVLYEMASGQPAFSGSTLAVVFDALLHRDPTPISDLAPHLPIKLSDMISRALEKHRERRYPNALALLAALKNLRQNLQCSRQHLVQGSEAPVAPWPRFADSIVVLPFENLAGDANTEYLSEGIAESIINNLSKLTTLRVVPRTTSFRYGRLGLDPVEAGRKLGVRVVLTGRLIERAERLIIGTELIDCTDGSQLWGEKYNRSLHDVFAMEADMAQEIANKLRIRLGPDEQEHLTQCSTDNVEAYKLYLKAMYHTNKWTPDGLQKGLDLLRQAIETDPVYPVAYVGLGYIYLVLGYFGWLPPREALPRAKSAALKALDIEAGHANAHILLGIVALFFDWDGQQSENHLRTALRLAPDHANCHWALGHWLLAMGRYEDAIAALKQAVQLDPLSAPMSLALGYAYYFARQDDKALEAYRATIELDPSFVPAYVSLPVLYARKGRYQEAFAIIDQFLGQNQFNDFNPIARARIMAIAGQADEAHTLISRLERKKAHPYIRTFTCAAVHAILGECDPALDLLEECYQERLSPLTFLAGQPEFDNLRGHPRFTDLLHRIGFERAAGDL
jgi:serine/threonine protein kinase/Tfp pilus assembly protein PilF